MIELINISLDIYPPGKKILHEISWHIGTGEKWVLFGRNGSGKTKLLEIVTGYNFPSSGEVLRFGKSALGHDIREIRKGIGYISTLLRNKFSPSETILDTVLSGLYASIGMYVTPGRKETERAMELLDTVTMADRAHDRFGTLSDGEKQKVLMLRAFINEPGLLIFDEPATHLDLPAREDLLGAIEKLCRMKPVSMIYVTHHTEEIAPLFDNIFILGDGRCLYRGPVREGLSEDILAEVFGRDIMVMEFNGRFYSMIR
jgi:iron complex transport system ATP-binding protein